MSALRILHVVPYYEAAWAYGGIPRLATTMANALARRGHQVTICTTDARDQDSRASRREPGTDGVDVRMFPNVSNALAYHLQFFTPIGLRSFLRSSATQFDVAHIHACHNLPGVIAAGVLARAGVPYIVQPNGTARPIERRIAAKQIFARTIGRRLLRDAARVIAVSNAEHTQLQALGVDASRLVVLGNPIDETEFSRVPDGSQFRQMLGITDQPIVLFLGKLTPRKGVDDLVRAFAGVTASGATLAIAGNDMGAGSRVIDVVQQLELERRVVMTGLLSGGARLAALAAADVVVYPSRDEIFGLVPLEALLCGVPVIVCDDSGCGEVISRVGGGMAVKPGDIPALTAAIDVMLTHPGAWRLHAASAAESVRRLYAGTVISEQLQALYEDVIGSGSRTRAGKTAPPTRLPATNRGVSFVVPVLNGRRLLRSCIDSILAQRDGRPFEIIAVDDGSTDGSLRLLEARQAAGQLTLLHAEGRGAAAAINLGIRAATHPILCQIDQDVVLQSGWLDEVLPAFNDGDVAAAQGHYITRPGAGFWARAMGRDLEHRYSRIRGPHVNHVCTGNTAYRASAVHQIGLLDEQLGYGYDNDLSYRLIARGYRLAFQRRAVSVHVWREGFAGYLRQQFGVGYGRLDVVARHPHRVTGDDVSGALMMAHGPATLLAMIALLAAAVLGVTGAAWLPAVLVAGSVVSVLAVERGCSGIVAWRRTGDSAALGFAIAHLARDLAWAYAISLWIARRLLGRAAKPAYSMPRVEWTGARHGAPRPTRGDLLAVIPAFNESASLRRVIADLSRVIPRRDIVIVNDGSTDGTADLLPELGVRWLTLSQRLGVGGAVRAGIRYAQRAGYQFVVRIDGDAQHRACDIPRVFRAVVSNRADVALGSRYLRRGRRARGWRRVSQAMLAFCLSIVTRRRVTDPTSGFWLFGPRALRLLSGNHPAGYAEPELVLFLHRNGLRLTEVPIRIRPRLAGRTSLTTPRAALAFARTMLAIVVVPLRRLAEGSLGD